MRRFWADVFNERMSRSLREIAWLILAATAIGIGVNFLPGHRLPLFRAYRPDTGNQTSRNLFQEADADMVRQFVSGGQAILVDARTPEEFAVGRIPGARSLPVAHFEEAFATLKPQLGSERIIIAYCRGFSCGDSQLLAEKLRANDLRVVLIYRGGIEDWMGKGYDLEK
jgi:rhodanese-related sulfurtransferase